MSILPKLRVRRVDIGEEFCEFLQQCVGDGVGAVHQLMCKDVWIDLVNSSNSCDLFSGAPSRNRSMMRYPLSL